MQTTPVQAELAKIWTNILRYTTFALPNLLMMDCERYGANVFEVIDLINRDYPRGGIALPGFTAGHLPAQGLRVLRGALERAGHAARRLARQRVGAAVPRRGHQAPARRSLRGRKVAVLGLAFKGDTDDERDSLAHKLIRLLERELADVAVHDPVVATPTAASRRRSRGADVVVVATNHRAFSRAGGAGRDRRARAAATASSSTLERFGAAQVFAYAERESPRCACSLLAAMNRVLVTGGAGTIGAAVVRRLLRDPDFEVRVSDQREAPALDARGLRGPHAATCATLDEARARDRPAARTSSTSPRSSAGSRTSTSSPTR